MSQDDVLFDVDPDTEVVRLVDGRRLSNELAEQLAEETLTDARRRNLVPGRKSPSGGGVRSSAGSVPVPFAACSTGAAGGREGGSLSELVREALEHYSAS